MKRNEYFEIGDIVDTMCGEQGVVVEVIDEIWVNILQCNGHIEKISIDDIWKSDTEVDGKAELNSLFLKIFGYSSVYDEDDEDDEEIIDISESLEDIPF